MNPVNPFAMPGRWYRGNTHAHTDRSDGEPAPHVRCEGYRRVGYDFVVITDHDVTYPVMDCCSEGFLAIQGAELHPENPYGGERYHIVAINLHAPIDARQMHVVEVLQAIGAQSGAAIMAHPYWSGHLLSDYEPLYGLYAAVEVQNYCCDRLVGKGLAELLWDAHLDRIGPIGAVAADDAHTAESDVGHAWIMVKAAELTPAEITAAIRCGACYATEGPVIEDLHIEHRPEGTRIHVQTGPAASICFKGAIGTGAVFRAEPGKPLTGATYTPRSRERYVRVVVTSDTGRRAWANPLFLSDYGN